MTTLTEARTRITTAWRARDAPGRLGFAASPTFALMAWIVAADAPRTALCASASAIPPIHGMAWMYLLMSLFHVSPWLKLAADGGRPLIHTNAKLKETDHDASNRFT